MLRSAFSKTLAASRFQAASLQGTNRCFSVSAVQLAKPLGKLVPAAKVKAKVKVNHNKKEKSKKSGMTPYDFKDAVRTLKFETYAKDLSDLNLSELSAANLAELKDKIVTFESRVDGQIELMGGYKKYQHHELFKQHCSMVTDNTVQIHESFVKKLDGSSKDNRACLLGPKGVGKSTLLSQAQALARSQYGSDLVLLHIAEPELFVQGFSDYALNPTLKLFHQPMFTKRWIKKLRDVNEDVFKKMPLLKDVTFTNKKGVHNYKKGQNNLHEYLVNCHDFGIVGPSEAFKFFIEHLQTYSKDFPVLFSVDNVNAIFEKQFTNYFHKDMTPIHYSEFEIGSLIKQLMSGEFSFAKGGVLLSESSDLGQSKTLKVGLKLQDLDPYAEDLDHPEAVSMMQNGGINTIALTNLSKPQARTLMEFWNESGVLQIRDYATKPNFKRPEDLAEGARIMKVGEFVNEMDPVEMYEKKLEKTYFVSGGNPGVFLKNNVLNY
ncbi:hypothetical protein PUMCH_003201 [Australozyma saopauloensis]|uniref:Small ribosomal subunit protein mS29 n=1 Tax=Australozyma saopauloensis TaxID=291208 RepID=A0AAX4HC53_9ASCO|nr:hypothetical protein PUMCH_003201 [[Candida] saopauloensis]